MTFEQETLSNTRVQTKQRGRQGKNNAKGLKMLNHYR